LQSDRTVIAPHYLRADPRAAERLPHFFRCDEIIDAPPDVSRPAVHHLAPPRIVSAARLELPESVDETRVEQPGKVIALLVGESGVAAVGLRVREVDLLVRNVEVAAENDRLLPR